MTKQILIIALALALALAPALSCGCAANVPGDGVPEDTTAETPGTSSVPQEVTTGMEESPKEYELLPDPEFRLGISLLSQKDHSNADSYRILKNHSFYGTPADSPLWLLAQWDSGPCLVENLAGSDPSTITDGKYRLFGYDAATKTMTFHLDTSAYYNGRPAKSGDYWPHLLIEAPDFGYAEKTDSEKKFYLCDSDSITVSFDIKLDKYEITPIDGDWVNAAQFLLYLYVRGVDTNDFCWFGLQLFDNRYDLSDHYVGYDGGKADASGAMIFSIGSKYVYKNSGRTLYTTGSRRKVPDAGGDWVHVSIDVGPYLQQMFRRGTSEHYFKAGSLGELVINGFNLGWETIGTFDHQMEVRNLSVLSRRSE